MGRHFLLAAVLLCAACGAVTTKPADDAPPVNATASVEPAAPEPPCLVRVAEAEVGVKEEGAPNSGPRVNQYLASTKLGPGFYWCASFCHWVHRECGTTLEPEREFAAAARFAREHVVWKKGDAEQQMSGGSRISEDGMEFTLFYRNLGRVGHVGIVVGEAEDELLTVEGNSSGDGSRNGDGVYRRVRDKETIWTVNDFR